MKALDKEEYQDLSNSQGTLLSIQNPLSRTGLPYDPFVPEQVLHVLHHQDPLMIQDKHGALQWAAPKQALSFETSLSSSLALSS